MSFGWKVNMMENWFAKRRRSKVLEMADRQMTLAIDTVIELEKSINAASNGRREDAKVSFEKLSATEHEIDELRRMVFEELTRGSLPPKDREDIMHLVKRLDEMADHVKDASRAVLLLLDAEVVKEMWKQFAATAKDLVASATTLRDAIEKLGTDPQRAMNLAKQIDEIEGRVDERYLKSKALLLEHSAKMETATILLLKDLIEEMEHVADSCDDTADYVRILTVAREVR
jgi:predicted phosphate transport protein (TIGR00153 family)